MTPLLPRQNPAPLPPNGLASQSNYFLYAGTPLLDLTVQIDVTEDIVGDLGFGFQVNCWSPVGPLCQWQQYVLAVVDTNQLAWVIQNWNHDMSVGCVNASHYDWVPLAQKNTIPAGWRLTVRLSNDTSANVVQAEFIVVDDTGTQRGDDKAVLAKVDSHTTAADLAPIVAVQVTLGGPTTSQTGPLSFGSTRLTSGAGTITCTCTTPMTVQGSPPAGTTGFNAPGPGRSVATGESSNSAYGPLPSGPDISFRQAFGILTPPEQIVGLDGAGHPREFGSIDATHWEQLDVFSGGKPASGSSLSAYQWAQTLSKVVVYLDGIGHVNEVVDTPVTTWAQADLTAITGAPAAGAGSRISGYSWAAGGSKQVVYLDSAEHVIELIISIVPHVTSKWTQADLTAITHGTLASPGSALCGYEWPLENAKQVVYLDGNGHVHELSLTTGGQWFHADLTQLTNATPAAAGSALVGYAWAAGKSKQVVYLDIQGHVHELWIVAGAGHWSHADLTELIHAPAAVAGSALAAYAFTAGNSKQVCYFDLEGHVHELSIVAGAGSWFHADLTDLIGAPTATSGSALAGYEWTTGRSKQVAYLGYGGSLHQLRIAAGAPAWSHLDLTAATGTALVAGSPLCGYDWLAD